MGPTTASDAPSWQCVEVTGDNINQYCAVVFSVSNTADEAVEWHWIYWKGSTLLKLSSTHSHHTRLLLQCHVDLYLRCHYSRSCPLQRTSQPDDWVFVCRWYLLTVKAFCFIFYVSRVFSCYFIFLLKLDCKNSSQYLQTESLFK